MTNQQLKRDPFYIIASRLFVGSIFILASVENYISLPFHIVPPSAETFLTDYTGGGAVLFLFKGIQFLVGSMVAFNLFVPLALCIMSSIYWNILIYTITMNSDNSPLVVCLGLCITGLFIFYRKVFKVFMRMQFYSSSNDEKTCDIIILQEVREKQPTEFSNAQTIYEKMSV